MTGDGMNEWKRSSFCSDAACVEVIRLGDNVAVRDSKHLDRQPLRFTEREWSAFVRGVKAGEFD